MTAALLLAAEGLASSSDDIDWGMTALVVGAIAGGLLILLLFVRSVRETRSRTSSVPTTPSPSGPSTRKPKPGEASGPKLKKTVAPPKVEAPEGTARVIAPVAGRPMPPEGSKLRMSMGRSHGRPSSTARVDAGGPGPDASAPVTCHVCSTVFPLEARVCPACGERVA